MAESARLNERHQRHLKTVRDEREGQERLARYIDEGMVDDQANADKILAFLRERYNGYLSVKTLEHAVTSLRSELKWSPLRAALTKH
jgi:hypothetical protein